MTTRRTTLALIALVAGLLTFSGVGAARPGNGHPPRGPESTAPGGGDGTGLIDGGIALATDGWMALSAALPGPLTPLGAVLWGAMVVFGAVSLFWVYAVVVRGRAYEPPAPEHGLDEVQVRIMTIDAASVVQETVDSLPAGLTDRHVVAEEPIDVDGAEVHVVPDSFDCDAVRKGRAIEWARRHLDCDREYVLYLDEDSVVESLTGLPDGDVVQLRERPRQTGSLLTYLADVYRMGVQLEQRAFARFSIPLFAWGGGIAVRKDLEDEVTWNRESLVEDTAFLWAAAEGRDLDFELAQAVCRNQAPPSFGEIFQQRRRWAAGNHQEAATLPRHYRLLTRVRNYAWAMSPVVTVVAVPYAVLGATVAYQGLFTLASLALAGLTLVWYLLGLAWYDRDRARLLLGVPLLPLVSLVHSAGTLAGVLDPPERFRVTEKV